MPRTALFLFAASLLTLGTAQADTLRCGTGLINEGDQMDQVLAQCGQPAKRVVTPPTPPRRGGDGQFIPSWKPGCTAPATAPTATCTSATPRCN